MIETIEYKCKNMTDKCSYGRKLFLKKSQNNR
jgi:hypothetical protein